jgi:S-formylglutathione hydrolase FrmB
MSRSATTSTLQARPVCVAILAALVALFAAPAARATSQPAARATSQLVTITIPDRHGEIPSKWLGYPGPLRADVLLPARYDPRRRYPLLVMLSGLNTNYAWYAETGLTKEFDGLDAIVVTPEGANGWYTDWWNDGQRGSPAWETYELDEVLPAILARYRILPQRRYHAIAGISMGGLGAAYLGGRLPGFFGSMASLSGFVDPQYFAEIAGPAMGLTAEAPLKGDYAVYPVDGPPRGFYADGHNPARLAMNMEQTRVFVSTGTGVPSRADLAAPTSIPVGSSAEGLVIYPMSQRYHSALEGAGIDVTYRAQPGGHNRADFADEIKAMLAWGPFKPVVEHPTDWLNDTVATSGQLWDIAYRFAQPPDHLVQFRRSGSSLSISAAGSAVTLTTSGGCVIHTGTPATVQVLMRSCRGKIQR